MNFSQEIQLRQLVHVMVTEIHAKFRKDSMTAFSRIVPDRQTNGQTDMGQSIRQWLQESQFKEMALTILVNLMFFVCFLPPPPSGNEA